MAKHKNSIAAKVRRYVKMNPTAPRAEVAKVLGVSSSYVSTVLWNVKRKTKEQILKLTNEAAAIAIARPAPAPSEWQHLGVVTTNTPLPIDMVEEKSDPVNHPAHYKVGGIETIDFIEAKKLNYNIGNVVKYVTRADHKGNRKQDLEKAKWYLERELSTLEETSHVQAA
jgi:hypothetical protein